MKTGRLKPWLHALGAVLAVLVLFALVRALQRDGPAALAAWRSTDVDATWIVLAGIASLGAHAFFIHGWKVLLNDSGVPVTFWPAARLFLVSNLGRYLPGAKAWQMGIIGMLAAESDLPVPPVVATSLFQGILGAVVGALLLALTGSSVLDLGPLWLVAPLAGIALLMGLPTLIRASAGSRLLSHRWGQQLRSITGRTMFTLVWTAAANWVAWGLALYALAVALGSGAGASVMAYVAAWIGPFLAGLIATFAPAGIGVRDELMRTMLTNSGMLPAAALVLMVVARVWTTLFEVVPAIAFLAVRRWNRREGPPNPA